MYPKNWIIPRSLKSYCSLASLSIFLSVTYSTQLRAQQPHKISLAKALSIAKANNQVILKSQINKELSEDNITETKNLRLPEIDLHGLYSRITNLTEFKGGFLQDKAVIKTIPEIYDISSSFRMPIYEGNKINNTIKKAKYEREIANLNVEKTENDIQLGVAVIFLEIYKMIKLQEIIEESIKEEQERLKEVKAFNTHGTVTKNEVLRAELQLSDRELNALTNEKNMSIALFELKTLLQLPEDEEMVIDTTAVLESEAMISEYNYYLDKTMKNEPMQIAGQEIEIRKAERDIVKSNYYPKISFFGNYNLRYPNYMFFPPSPYLYSLGQVGIELTYNLSGLYKNRSRVKSANLKIAAQQTELEIIKNEEKNRLFKNYTQHQEIADKLPVADKALELAIENYRIVKLKYLNQLVLITEMVDADNALLQARYNKIALNIDVVVKRYELLHTAGILNK
ncbi:TolC family protein [Flavobacterium cerinum]|uniref:TolC family protein n=1 Tax=Flavobacterium cerinum TaxID=2502784 RepID=A0A3S3R082_9FLAO|nr:TolC family protein [Flavobacterium cerinum]RWX00335.1 TolC family protein [Flavobacterium cerinum]